LSPKHEELELRKKKKLEVPGNQTTDRTYLARPADSKALSAQQRRFWVLDQLERTDAPHNVPAAVEIRGRLDSEALEEAIRGVVERRDVLRSRFVLENDEPRAITYCFELPPLPVVNLTQLPQDERNQEVRALAVKEFKRAFDLQAGPLFRATLYQLSDVEQLLALTFHRIICDTASSLLVTKEIAASYVCITRDLSPPLPESQYVDSVRAQGLYLGSNEYEGDLAYWKTKLKSAPAGLELPADRPRPLVPSFHGAEQVTAISGESLADLRRFSEAEQSSTFLVLLSAFFCLLARYTAGEDIVIGTEVSGRSDAHMVDVVGAVSNQLVLRADCSGDLSFRDLLSRISHVWAEAQQHQAMPFGTLLDALRVPRDMSRSPLFQISFNYNTDSETVFAAGLRWDPVRFEAETEVLDLSVGMTERDQEIELRFSYSTDLFESSTIARVIRHYFTLLDCALDHPEKRISQLHILTPKERHQILVEWNATEAEYPRQYCVHQLFEQQVERTPEAVACQFESEQITYLSLNQRANQIAHALQRRGIGPGQHVGILVERSLDMIVGLLGIQKSGAAYVPLDPGYPADRLRFMLEDAAVTLLLSQQSLRASMPAHNAEVVCLDSNWAEIAHESNLNPQTNVQPEDLMYVIFTSGSTGRPKGVQVPHRAVVNLLTFMAHELHMGPHDVFPALASLAFDMCIPELYLSLITGGRVVLGGRHLASNGEELAALLRQTGATIIHATPTTWMLLLEAGFSGKGLKRVVGAEPLPRELCVRLLETDSSLYNFYGPTETTVWSAFHRFCSPDQPVVVGRPLANTQIYLLDQSLQPVPPGVTGEIYIAGDGVTYGYLNRPELTKEKFVGHPFSDRPGARLYRTGDLGRYHADGRIECLGRLDFQVKMRGFRIELSEIESVLAQRPEVARCVVVVREDRPDQKRLVAYVVLVADASFNSGNIRDDLRQLLPDYMVPTAFVVMDDLPLSPNKKVDRRALPPPEDDDLNLRSDDAAPRTKTEKELVAIWGEMLGIQRVGIHDDFFDLGGHSLMAARLLSQIHRLFGRKIPLAALFRAATVESLAQLIDQEQEVGSDPVVLQIQRGDSRLPFFAIVPPGEESIGYAMLARHMGPKQTVYKIQGHAPIIDGKRPYSGQEMQHLTHEYIAAMRTVQPRGPYCLGGLCDGTHIAEQIVLSLEAQGEEVGLFAIFDTWVLQHSQRRWLWKVYYYGERLRELCKLNFTDRLAAAKEILNDKIQALAGKKSARTDWPQTYWPEDFVPPRFRAPVILFRRPKQPFYYIKDSQLGWGARTTSVVEIHEVDFHHLEVLREPQVRIFGEELAECIARLSQRTLDSRMMREIPDHSPVLTTSIQQHGS
jgi:amino acid adenylation domain-containing protein